MHLPDIPRDGGSTCHGRRRFSCVVLAATLLIAGSCREPVGPGKSGSDRLWISNTGLSLEVGESAGLTALAILSPDGAPSPPAHADWSSSNREVLEVSPEGRITARGVGHATVYVQADGRMDSATVRVGPAAAEAPQWATVQAGASFTCALDAAGERYCWGENPFGAHGNGTRRLFTNTNSPVAAGDPLRYVSLSGGYQHACGITTNGSGYCWGNNTGQSSDYELLPQRLGVSSALREVRSGVGHACALDAQDRRYCWGSNLTGALGMVTSSARQVAPLRVDEPLRFATLAAGYAHTCGLTVGGEAYCWGTAVAGELGEGSPATLRPVPHPVAGGLRFSTISAGNAATCGLVTDGVGYCWGLLTSADSAGPRREESAVPVRLATPLRFAQLEVGSGHTCGRTEGGEVFCWGLNEFGQAGVEPGLGPTCASGYAEGPVPCVAVPNSVSLTIRFRSISVGRHHTCGVTLDAGLYCWGRNDAGQLGAGRMDPYSASPVRVAVPFR